MMWHLIRLVTDVVLLLSVTGLMWTGLLLAWVLPPGSRGGRGMAVLDMTRHDWGDWHYRLAMVMVGAAVVHAALNWSWLCGLALRVFRIPATTLSPRRRHLAGVALLLAMIALIGSTLWLAAANRQDNGVGQGRQHRGPRAVQSH